MGLVLVLCSTKTNLFFLLPSLLVLTNFLVGVKSQIDPYYYCPSTTSNYTDGSKYQSNLNRLLYRSSLYINNSGNNIYAKASEGEDPNKVHGTFLCGGDVAPKDCKNCIDEANEQMLRACPLKKQAIIWYSQCMVRYSDNVSFVSTLDYSHYLIRYNTQNVSRPAHFLRILGEMFDNLTIQATSVNSNLKYAENSDEIESFQRLYGMVRCLPDLSAVDCRDCLLYARSMIGNTIFDASIPRGINVLVPSCNFRYELYPFFNANSALPTTSQLGNKDKGV